MAVAETEKFPNPACGFSKISTIFTKVAALIPLFWTSSDVCPGFESQCGSLFACFLVCVILRFTFGVTPAHCIEVSMVAKPFSFHILTNVSASIVGGWGQDFNPQLSV